MRPISSILPIFLVILGIISVLTLRSIDLNYGLNQLLFLVVSLIAFWVVAQLPYFWLRRGRWWWYGAVLGLLLLTLVIGRATHGSVSWLRLGSYRLQASEFLKPVLVLLLAVEAGRRPVNRWSRLGRYAVLAAAPLGLVLLQPDLGTALIVFTGVTTVYLLSGAHRRHIFLLSLLGLAAGALAWQALLKPYQRNRILTFLNPASDPLGSGYNAQQAIIAVGAGSWLGTGFGNGAQSHLRFLPERQTDFLLATYAEETGFVGLSLLLILYAGLYGWIAYLLSRLGRSTEVNLGAGLLAMLVVQSFINIGMNLGITPITGVTLPFFSLGGSSLLSSSLSLGIIEAARRHNTAAQAIIS